MVPILEPPFESRRALRDWKIMDTIDSGVTARGSGDTCWTMSVPAAGKKYFDLGRNAAYAAAQRGDIPTVRVGRLLRVPIRAIERMLEAAANSGKA